MKSAASASGQNRWLLLGVATLFGVGVSGHEDKPRIYETVERAEALVIDTLEQARAAIRMHVAACIDNATVIDGIPPLATCLRAGCVDGCVLGEIDATLPYSVSRHMRMLAELLMKYPELAPEMPGIAHEHLSSLGSLHPKRIAQPFLSSDFSSLRDRQYVRETSGQYLQEIEKHRAMRVALD